MHEVGSASLLLSSKFNHCAHFLASISDWEGTLSNSNLLAIWIPEFIHSFGDEFVADEQNQGEDIIWLSSISIGKKLPLSNWAKKHNINIYRNKWVKILFGNY